MPERGMGRVYRPTRQCLRCKGKGCGRCKNGRRQIATWHIQFSHRSKQYRESARSTKKADALRLLKKRMSEIGAGKKVIGAQVDRTTFEDLCEIVRDDYRVNGRKSQKRLGTSIDRLSEFFAGYRAIDITTDVLKKYINRRYEDGRAASTIRNETNTLRRAMNLAVECGKLEHVPHFPKIEVNNVRTGFFEADEFQAVLANLPGALKPVAEFGYLSGWRLGEILTLRWTQVDLAVGVIRLEVGSTKTGEGRTLPFNVLPALKTLMERQLAYTQEVQRKRDRMVPFVFHRNGREIRAIATAWDSACAKAGCPDRLFHDLRRTAVRNLERAGVPRSIAMKITGHKTEAVYRRYAIVNEADVAEGLGKLAVFLGERR